MATRDAIINFCNDYLEIDRFKDHALKGMQVIGSEKVKKIVTGVSASLELFEAAAQRQADMVLVHHGEFWEYVSQQVGQVRRERLMTLFEHNMTLAAYHIPLDAHPIVGNNVQLVELCGMTLSKQPFGEYEGNYIGAIGETDGKLKVLDLAQLMGEQLQSEPLVLAFGPEKVKRVGFVSGGAAGSLPEAIALGLDTFVTGESKESNFALAKESGINVIYAGHYATEKLGVQAFGELLKKEFKVEHEFVEIECPL